VFAPAIGGRSIGTAPRTPWSSVISGSDVVTGDQTTVVRVLIRPDWAGDCTMKRNRHTMEQIIRKLTTAEQLIEQLLEQSKTVADVCRVIEVTRSTYHRWRQQYVEMQAVEAKRLSQLQKDNARFKKLM